MIVSLLNNPRCSLSYCTCTGTWYYLNYTVYIVVQIKTTFKDLQLTMYITLRDIIPSILLHSFWLLFCYSLGTCSLYNIIPYGTIPTNKHLLPAVLCHYVQESLRYKLSQWIIIIINKLRNCRLRSSLLSSSSSGNPRIQRYVHRRRKKSKRSNRKSVWVIVF